MDDRGKSEALQIKQLVLPPVARNTAVQRRLTLPIEGDRPKLYVIVTPPEVRERWLLWVAIRQSALLTFLITFALIAAASAII
ncbi:MAG: hypothetical protein M4D80_08745 [Myxococcota bacterium]|nr:hypothetical protein [Deltaproteobacteria bacterium]MDQ3335237.1 hypothetical protein [Myxococcota bacterium]